jgi:hypothetical protein
MNDYFFTPMNKKQLEFWERRRSEGFLFYVLIRGIVLVGIPVEITVAGIDVFLRHQLVSTALIGASFDALFWAITYPALEWSSNQRRYRKTMEELGEQEIARLNAVG